MNKSELVSAVADNAGVKKVECESVLNAFIEVVTKTLKSGGDIRLVGFGTFAVSERKATTGRNPSTGKPISIPACKVPKFKAGQTLKDSVNGK
ncbi:MAG: HU family DNA-binding protein [Holosporales bacterium]|nr:HU family DNA-binding protein [Holosporales bacterium]